MAPKREIAPKSNKKLARKRKADKLIDEASIESFPCSDPPAWIFRKPEKSKKKKSSK